MGNACIRRGVIEIIDFISYSRQGFPVIAGKGPVGDGRNAEVWHFIGAAIDSCPDPGVRLHIRCSNVRGDRLRKKVARGIIATG